MFSSKTCSFDLRHTLTAKRVSNDFNLGALREEKETSKCLCAQNKKKLKQKAKWHFMELT